jgi:hypothetical protein
MRNFTLLIIIFLACSSYSFSQDYNFGREVEAKVFQNNKSGLDQFSGVYLNYDLKIWGINSAQEANDLDLTLMRTYSSEIISAETKYNGGQIECRIQTFGAVSADRVKRIMSSNHADFEKFEKTYTIEKIIVPESRFTEVEKFEISKAKFDALPDNEKQDVLNQTKKYTIVE